jgi:hypothetical protein
MRRHTGTPRSRSIHSFDPTGSFFIRISQIRPYALPHWREAAQVHGTVRHDPDPEQQYYLHLFKYAK